MTSSNSSKSPHHQKLKLSWLQSVCCEFSADGKSPNPYFNSGIRAKLRHGLDRPDQESGSMLTGYLSRAGWSEEHPPYFHIPYQITCSFFACYPHAVPPNERNNIRPNLGTLCRIIALHRQKDDDSEETTARSVNVERNSFTPRFERILACRKPVQMLPHLRGVVRLLNDLPRSHDLDFNGFLTDLCRWEIAWADENGPRMKWARQYWREEKPTGEEPTTTQS